MPCNKFLSIKFLSISSSAQCKIFSIYWINEQKCQKYTKRIAYYLFFHMSIFFLNFLNAIINIILGNLNTSTWSLSFTMSVPFDKTCVWGWLLTSFIEINTAISYSFCMVSITSYFICCCFYIEALCEHFDALIKLSGNEVERIREKNQQITGKFYLKAHNQLSEAVKLHVKIFE